MIGLGALVVDHFDAVEADFARFYGIDLPVALWGPEPVTYRRLAVLVRGIPAESALGVACGGYRPGWGATEELLALVAETIDHGNRLYFKTHSKKGAQQPKPLAITRPPDPNEEPPTRRPATSEDLVAMFGAAARYTGPPRGEVTEDPDPDGDVLAADELAALAVPDPPDSPL
jgi:hypothetical protein